MQFLNEIWERIKIEISKEVNKPSMELWINPLSLIELTGEHAILMIASSNHAAFHKDVLLKQYAAPIQKAFCDEFKFDIQVDFIIESDLPDYKKPSVLKEIDLEEENQAKQQVINTLIADEDYTFDNFVVGGSNQFVFAACGAVADNPGGAYNPLFIHGPSGLGKTHLLCAIQNKVSKNNPDAKIVYISGEEFTNEIIAAINTNKTNEFRNKYRNADLFLIDDIQFIGGKESTQMEFFHTFNALYESNAQIVLSSDRPPKEIQLLEERLRGRFEMGLIADVGVPDYELRYAIIKRKCEFLNIELSNDIIEYIANKLKSNVRQIEGVIKKIKALYLLTGAKPTIAVAQTAIRDVLNENEPTSVTIDKIIIEVARFYNISADAIKGKNRSADIALARQVAIYLIRDITGISLPDIGEVFERDHSTIHHSYNKINDMVATNPEFKHNLNAITKNVKGN